MRRDLNLHGFDGTSPSTAFVFLDNRTGRSGVAVAFSIIYLSHLNLFQ